MTSASPPNAGPVVTNTTLAPGGSVVTDLACIGCGYNLRTLSHAGRCPECGRAVWDSATVDDLRCAPPEYLARLAKASRVLQQCFFLDALATALAALGLLLMNLTQSARWLVVAAALAQLPLLALAGGALWLLAARDPRHTRRVRDARTRSGLRYALLATAAGPLGLMPSLDVLGPLLLLAGFAGVLLLPALLAERVSNLGRGLRAAPLIELVGFAGSASYASLIAVGIAAVGCAGADPTLVSLGVFPISPLLYVWHRTFAALAGALDETLAPTRNDRPTRQVDRADASARHGA